MAGSRTVHARGRLSLVVGTILMALMFAALAYADDIANTLDASVDANFEAMALNVGGGTGSTTLVVVTRNDDGKSGCNLTGSKTLGVSVSSNTGVATVSPASLTFGSCGDVKTITVTPVAAGTANVTLSQTSNTTDAPSTSPRRALRSPSRRRRIPLRSSRSPASRMAVVTTTALCRSPAAW